MKAMAVMALVSASSLLRGQNSSGSLRGVVQDATRARVAGATVELDLMGSAQTRHTTADAQGEFRIEALTPGSWHVGVEARGLQVPPPMSRLP